MSQALVRAVRSPQVAWVTGLVVACLCLTVQMVLWALENGPTFDEKIGYEAGWQNVWEEKYFINLGHPPLWRMTAAYLVWIWSVLSNTEILTQITTYIPLPARAASMVFALMVLLGMALWVRQTHGRLASLLAAFFLAFEPNMIVHGAVLTPDMAVTAMVFLSAYAFWWHGRSGTWTSLLVTGLAVSGALTSKFSAFPFLAAVFVCGLVTMRGRVPWPGWKSSTRRTYWTVWPCVAVWLLQVFLMLLALYGPHEIRYYYFGILSQFRHSTAGQYTYFFGTAADHPWLLYFFVSYLIKSPLTILGFLGLGLATLGRRSELWWWWVLAPLLFFAALWLTALNLGVRYALPAFPFFVAIAGSGAAWLWRRSKYVGPLVVGLALLFQVWGVVRLYPHTLAYANEAWGGPESLHRYVVDSNLDWGQNAGRVPDVLRRYGVSDVRLAPYGVVRMSLFGIRYQSVTSCYESEQSTDLARDPRHLLIIGVAPLVGGCTGDGARFAWLRERTPIEIIGYGTYVYDITDDAEAHVQLAMLYNRMRWYRHMRHELLAARAITNRISDQGRAP